MPPSFTSSPPPSEPLKIGAPHVRRRMFLQTALAALAFIRGKTAQAANHDVAASSLRGLGYRGDGLPHPLSSIENIGEMSTSGWSLRQWQTIFPRAFSLNDEIDRHAIQLMCDLHPQGAIIDLPIGIAMIDIGIVTGGSQNIRIRGADRDLTEIRFSQPGGTLWAHGHTIPADGTWSVENLTIRPMAICAAAFDVAFSGKQPPWCHIMRDILIAPSDGTNYFETACITRNIKRGLDWQNVVVFGRHFHVLSSNAFEFPSNADQTPAGNSYNFNNVMTVGYAYGLNFGFLGFTASNHHMHEEVQMYNFQSYAGKGIIRAVNKNYNFAAADNFTLSACGWQGTGPALDFCYLEHVKIRDSLFVNDGTTDDPIIANLTDCASLLLEANEVFSLVGENLVGITVHGAKTRNVTLRSNDVVANSHFKTFLRVGQDVQPGMLEEVDGHFAGSATYTLGKVEDMSQGAVSQTRATELGNRPTSPPAIPGSTSVAINNAGDTDWSATIEARPIDNQGNIEISLPQDLFRSIKFVTAQAVGGTSSWVVVETVDVHKVKIRYPNPGIAQSDVILTNIRAIGI